VATGPSSCALEPLPWNYSQCAFKKSELAKEIKKPEVNLQDFADYLVTNANACASSAAKLRNFRRRRRLREFDLYDTAAKALPGLAIIPSRHPLQSSQRPYLAPLDVAAVAGETRALADCIKLVLALKCISALKRTRMRVAAVASSGRQRRCHRRCRTQEKAPSPTSSMEDEGQSIQTIT
jgi:hypothetical protein